MRPLRCERKAVVLVFLLSACNSHFCCGQSVDATQDIDSSVTSNKRSGLNSREQALRTIMYYLAKMAESRRAGPGSKRIGSEFVGKRNEDASLDKRLGSEFLGKRMGSEFLGKRMGSEFLGKRLGSEFLGKRMGSEFLGKRLGSEFLGKRMGSEFLGKRMGSEFLGKRIGSEFLGKRSPMEEEDTVEGEEERYRPSEDSAD